MPVVVGEPISLEDVAAVARGERAELSPAAARRMRAARAVVEAKVAAAEVVYGVTTGFGSLANVHLHPEQARALQHALLRSHGVAVGPALPPDEVRAMLLLRAHVLALGHSGVRPLVVERLLALLNAGALPVVPEQGSLGASGDLAPLAHLAQPLVGEGEVTLGGERVPAADALARLGLEPLALEAKEGLALINGTQGMLAIGILAAERGRALAKAADVAAALSIEAILGTDVAFDERIQRLRPHPGQAASASNLRRLLAGSEIVASHRESEHAVQDAYSLRCAPQVAGAFRDALAFVAGVLQIEAGSVSDNPLVFPEDEDAPDPGASPGADAGADPSGPSGRGEVLSGGNFHGQPVSVALDTLAASVVGLASIAERRLYRLLDPAQNNGLPAFLVEHSGLNSGFMIVQYTAASLVSECKSLAHPAAVDSITSSAGQEDHVSMGMIAARHARACVANAEAVVAMEALAAAQGVELRSPLRPAPATAAALAAVRRAVPHLDADRRLKPDVDAAIELVRSGALVAAVEAVAGPLD